MKVVPAGAATWLHWTLDGSPQRWPVEMIGEGFLEGGEDAELTFSYLVRLLRPIDIGLGAENYARKLKEQIDALHVAPITAGGQSGRRRTFVLGLDDRRFPGAVVECNGSRYDLVVADNRGA